MRSSKFVVACEMIPRRARIRVCALHLCVAENEIEETETVTAINSRAYITEDDACMRIGVSVRMTT